MASSFHSVWALELLLLLKREGRSFSHEEPVSSLRASPAVVEKAINSLNAAGLASGHDESMIYLPVSPDIARKNRAAR